MVANLASELGALTVAVVTKPFSFEGKRRMMQAEQALEELVTCVDTVIVIPNERLLDCVEKGTSFFEAFRIADDILRQAVQGISDIITVPGIINRDFADVKTIMHGQGYAVMGTAVASGANRASEAANRAISSPLLEDNCIQGAQGILINVTGSSSLSLQEVHEASTVIQKAAHENANIIFGAVLDDVMKDSVKITVIAAGFRDVADKKGDLPRHSYMPKTWKSGRGTDSPEMDDAYGPGNGAEVEHTRPAVMAGAVSSAATARVSQPSHAPRQSLREERSPASPTRPSAAPAQRPLITQREDGGNVREPSRNEERESEREIRADDLDVPTFLRRQAQKA